MSEHAEAVQQASPALSETRLSEAITRLTGICNSGAEALPSDGITKINVTMKQWLRIIGDVRVVLSALSTTREDHA